MASATKTVTLPPEHSAYVDRMVESGAYASDAEVVEAGLRALQERDAAIERWLREGVAPVYDAIQADAGRAVSLDDAFADIRARHDRRTQSGS